MHILATTQLTKSFKAKNHVVTALDNVDFTVNAGDFVAITGESGSGKSTLLQILGGLDNPSSGEVVVNGQDITKLNDKQLSKFRSLTFGFVFQNFYLQPFLTLRQNLELPAVFAEIPKETQIKRTEKLAHFLDLEDRLDHLPRELSGGQIQRAAILRALYNEPSVILADEPTGNLDKKNAIAVLELLKKINKELNTTIILVTHDSLASGYANRTVHLESGRIV